MSFADGTVESYTVGRTAVRSVPEMLAQRLSASQIGHIVIVENPAGTYTSFQLIGLPASDLINWKLLSAEGGGGGSGGSVDWGDITDKPTEFPPATHTHAWGQISARPTLIDALATLTGDGILNKAGSALNLIGSTAVGLSLLTAANQSAGRLALGLGAAATLGIDAEGGVPTINAGKINPSFIPNITFWATPFPVADQAARLALSSAVVGSIAIQDSPASNWVLQALPASTAGNWLQFAVPDGTVSSVFGLTGAVAMTDLTAMSGAAALNDLVAGYDTSVGAHRSITLQKIIDLVAVPTAATAAPANIGTAAAGTALDFARSDHVHNLPDVGTAATTAYPASVTTDAKGRITGITAGTAPASPSNATPQPVGTADAGTSAAVSRADHAHAITKVPAVSELIAAKANVNGAYVMQNGATADLPFANTYHYTLTGNGTITLPTITPLVNSVVGFAVWVDQDATGGRSLSFVPPSGYTIVWDGGSMPAPATAANGATEYVFRIRAGETRFKGSQVFKS